MQSHDRAVGLASLAASPGWGFRFLWRCTIFLISDEIIVKGKGRGGGGGLGGDDLGEIERFFFAVLIVI